MMMMMMMMMIIIIIIIFFIIIVIIFIVIFIVIFIIIIIMIVIMIVIIMIVIIVIVIISSFKIKVKTSLLECKNRCFKNTSAKQNRYMYYIANGLPHIYSWIHLYLFPSQSSNLPHKTATGLWGVSRYGAKITSADANFARLLCLSSSDANPCSSSFSHSCPAWSSVCWSSWASLFQRRVVSVSDYVPPFCWP